MFEPMTDAELIAAARRYQASAPHRLPKILVPCDTLAGREVAQVDLTSALRPIVTRNWPMPEPGR